MSIDELKYFIRAVAGLVKHISILKNKAFKEKQEQFRIIKSMHTIEKGLSLKEVKLGFGVKKILNLMNRISSYQSMGFDVNDMSVQMAMGAIKNYIDYHTERNALNEEIRLSYEKLLKKIPTDNAIGGAVLLKKENVLDFDFQQVRKAIYSRHSIRNFSDEDVNVEKILEAVEDANHCPNACNRQPTRVHIISNEESKKYIIKNMQGVGGFADDCKVFLIITGSMSAFDFGENNQWILNAGIFVGNLVLSLHSRGIASCVVQRPFVRSNAIKEMRNKFNIPDDEEVMCIIGLGMYPDEFYVPQSARRSSEELVEIH